MGRVGKVLGLAAAIAGVLAIQVGAAQATVYTVSPTTPDVLDNMDGCSLREAIEAADTDLPYQDCTPGGSGDDTIRLQGGTYTINTAGMNYLSAGGTGNLLLERASAASPIVNGNGFDRVMRVNQTTPTGAVTIDGLTISGGNMPAFTDFGAGIFVAADAQLVLRNSVIRNNQSGSAAAEASGGGLGIADDAQTIVSVSNTTFAQNTASGDGGAIYQAGPNGTLTLNGVTISNNSADVENTPDGGIGGGLYRGGTVQIANTIIANNAGNTAPDCVGLGAPIGNLGGNVIENTAGCGFSPLSTDSVGVDPMLGLLLDNGGPRPTETFAIGTSSVAFDRGGGNCPATDQRGLPRPGGDACDSGAFELQVPPTQPPGGGSTPPIGTPTPPVKKKCKKGRKLVKVKGKKKCKKKRRN